MNYETLKTLFESNKNIKFKLYSLDYIIEDIDGIIQVYAIDYPTRKSKYNSFKETMNNFKVYNEPLVNQIDRIIIINKGDE